MDVRELFRLEIAVAWLEQKGFHIADYGLLGAALDRPWARFEGAELYPDPWLKAGALLNSLQSSHPLLDGNKRAGVLLTALLLDSLGIDEQAATDDQWFDLMVYVAENQPGAEAIAEMLRNMYGQ